MHARSADELELRQPARRFGRLRTRLVRTLERTASCLGGRALYRRRHLRAGAFRVRSEELGVRALAPEFEGLCCVQLSDLHAGPFLKRGDLEDVIRAVNAQAPDLVFLTGDLITHGWRDALELVEDLGAIRARLGVLAVFGNHDYHGRREAEIERALAPSGVVFLRNSSWSRTLGSARLTVVGLEDLEEGRLVDPQAARREVRAGDLELVLCHHPSGGPQLARPGCAAVFSGHTHGGQFELPGLGGLGPAHPGLRVRLGDTTLIVHRGLGTLGLPVRIGAPAEIVVARLRAEAR